MQGVGTSWRVSGGCAQCSIAQLGAMLGALGPEVLLDYLSDGVRTCWFYQRQRPCPGEADCPDGRVRDFLAWVHKWPGGSNEWVGQGTQGGARNKRSNLRSNLRSFFFFEFQKLCFFIGFCGQLF